MNQQIQDAALELARMNLAYAQALKAEDAFLQNKFFGRMIDAQNYLWRLCETYVKRDTIQA